ncbi:DUF4097 family beta strand repeat-containing protein [Lunatibacter salilacus]|uniref:DUF4097 family beta strand repeat-containing protein n=1 Tax=Lunatibacter salilacus TaxID=2483804 RepID=UPI00131C1AA5|nr:DUF4097 family beta strand repeat-containing protein [Lunatibacter salilacus]
MKTQQKLVVSEHMNSYPKFFNQLRLLVIVTAMLLTGCLDDNLSVVSEINEEFSGIKKIEVDGGFLEVEYIGESGMQDVSMDAVLRSNSDKRYEIIYNVDGETLKIEVKTSKGISGNLKGEGTILLKGPRNILLDLESGSGSLSVQNVVSTETNMTVASGSIFAKNISATNIFLSSSSGLVKAEDLTGKLNAVVSSGKMEFSGIDGNIDADGSSGELKFNGINGVVNATISSGKIEMNNVRFLGKTHLTSGQLFATNSGLGAETSLKVSSGSIYIQTLSNLSNFNFNITTGSGIARVGSQQASGSLIINNGASNTIRGEVSSGKIEIEN